MIIEYDNLLGGQIATAKAIKAAIKRRKLKKKLKKKGLSKKAIRKELRTRRRKLIKSKLKKLHTAAAFISPTARAAKIALAIKNRKKIAAKLKARKAARRAKRAKRKGVSTTASPVTSTINQQPITTVERDEYTRSAPPVVDTDTTDYEETPETEQEETEQQKTEKGGIAKYLLPAGLLALPFLFGRRF